MAPGPPDFEVKSNSYDISLDQSSRGSRSLCVLGLHERYFEESLNEYDSATFIYRSERACIAKTRS